jgi:hypothetical protein
MLLLGIFFLFCLALLAEMIRVAPLVDDNQKPIEESDMPRQIAVKRYERFQQ